MRKIILMIVAIVCATSMMVSCKKDYQKLSTEFIRNLPDSCELLVQVDNEAEHLVYYKGASIDLFFCYNAETEKSESIVIPAVDGYDAPISIIGAGKENIMVGHNASIEDGDLPKAYVQLYNLKTQGFKEFTICNWYDIDEGTKQLSCFSYDVDRYGDGKRTTDIYDFDGNLLSKKDVEVCNFKEVPPGTLAARQQAAERQTASTFFDTKDTPNPTTTSSNNPHQNKPQFFYCENCGAKFSSIRDLTSNRCNRSNGNHKLYEGTEKDSYVCKYCGRKFPNIKELTANRCLRNPSGERHSPVL